MISHRGLPTRRIVDNDQNSTLTTQSNTSGSGWDRFNGKRTPIEMELLRHQFKELMMKDTVNQVTSYEQQESKTENIKGIIRRIWNEVDPDRQDRETPLEVKKKNFKGLIVELWTECFPDEPVVSKHPVHKEEEPICMSVYERYRRDPF